MVFTVTEQNGVHVMSDKPHIVPPLILCLDNFDR
jgi:hypothetical protein